MCRNGTIDLLASIFVVSQTARRCADVACREYQKGRHGNATRFRRRKEDLYELKNRGVAAGFVAGRIAPVKVIGNLAQYQGEGFILFSPLLPAYLEVPCVDAATDPLVDSKPADVVEPTLKAAERMLEQLPEVPGSSAEEENP